MVQPAAKEGDQVLASDTHIVMVPSGSGQTPTPIPGHVFTGKIDSALSGDVFIQTKAAAVKGSGASNQPKHIPMPPGVGFQTPPSNQATIEEGSSTVFINGKPAARNNDAARTCDESPDPRPKGKVVAVSTVEIGG